MIAADLISRLAYVIENEVRMPQTQFAIKAGLYPSNFSKMMCGKQPITNVTLEKIAKAYNLNYQWLRTGEGEMYAASYPEKNYTEGVPYYDEVFECGFDELFAPSSENPEYLIKMPGYEKATLWCNASGHSMEPEISNGDIIALKRIEDFTFLPYGDVYGIITKNGLRTIKRLGRASREGYYRLIPTNKNYDEQEIPVSIISAVYRVMGAMKAF